jgi:sugar phosphate isomerase/epimerase
MHLGFRFPRRWYPYRYRPGQLMPPQVMREIFGWAAAAGFSGCELSTAHQDFPGYSDGQLDAVAGQLLETGLNAAAYNPGGFRLHGDGDAAARTESLVGSARIAARLGAPTINLTLPGPGTGGSTSIPSEYLVGARHPLGSGRGRPPTEPAALALALAELADACADEGITVALEIHQNSYIEDSDAALALLGQIDRRNVGLNPDLGNILWARAIPYESSEEAIERLAPHAVYVHMKNLRRVFVAGLDRAAFVRTSLLERGDVDWRWAISVLNASGYSGCLTFEGDYAEGWDFRRAMERNAEYVSGLIADVK